jgi:predicted O-methyltransferase YrrM
MTHFTQDWFSHNIENFKAIKSRLLQCDHILEIGCFEGRATCWMLEHMLSPTGKIICLDTFNGSEEHSNINLDNTYSRWQANVDEVRGKGQETECYIGKSYDTLAGLISGQQQFDFIYVDGSHTAYDVMTDACMAWGMLKHGGIMLFDDYLWEDVPGILHRPRLGVDYFTTLFSEQNQLVLLGYQLALRKL